MAYEAFIQNKIDTCVYPQLIPYYQKCLADYKAGLITPGTCNGDKCMCGTCSCFVGTDLVKMANCSKKEVKLLQKGDVVFGGFKVVAKIEFINTVGTVDLVSIPAGPTMTPWHPVCIGTRWAHAVQLHDAHPTQCFEVYNFILDRGHILNVNAYDCITLGHGYTGDPVLKHPYFGSKRVVEDMKKLPGFDEGHVVIVDAQLERDDDGLVSRIF